MSISHALSLTDEHYEPQAMTSESFYSECTAYFEYLRKSGREDNGFEDEYYFTMPYISDQQ